MNHNVYLYILVMAGVTYLIRLLPLTLIKKEIKNVYIKSFLYYVPYVTLSVMTFPAILHATASCVVRRSSPGSGCSSGLEGKEPVPGVPGRMCHGGSAGTVSVNKTISHPRTPTATIRLCPCPPVHDGMDDRNHEYGHDSACITVVIQVHAPYTIPTLRATEECRKPATIPATTPNSPATGARVVENKRASMGDG